MIKRVGKRGDTLIEVMLAVGIFSMVAIAVVAVMSGGTSSAQTALETTLAREEIDAQAEALRFIQSSYIAEKDNENGKFAQLWKNITAPSNVVTGKDNISAIAQYSPSDCTALYDDDGEVQKYGFIINTHALGSENPSSSLVRAANTDLFSPASTYPRLIYDDEETLATASGGTLDKVEGIYIIAVKDPETTQIVGKDNNTTSAYYDFYIRTCWYGTGDQSPSTISTVMRLYDPGIVNN